MAASGFFLFKSRGLWVYLAAQQCPTTRIHRKQENNLTAQVKKAPNYWLFGWLVLGNVKFLVFLGIGNVKFDVFLGLGNVKNY